VRRERERERVTKRERERKKESGARVFVRVFRVCGPARVCV